MDQFFLLWLGLLMVVILSPVIVVGTVIFWLHIGYWIDRLVDFVNPPPPPYCDIDPLCHPAFCWAKDGSGWIGNVRVRESNAMQPGR